MIRDLKLTLDVVLGRRRFALPEPVEPWPDIFDATSRKPKQCTQKTPVAPESERIIVGKTE